MAEKKTGKKAARAANPDAKKGDRRARGRPSRPSLTSSAKRTTRQARPGVPSRSMRSDSAKAQGPASGLITARIRELGDWRGEKLALVRRLIHEADPAVVEEWKWRGTPVWSHDGIVCTGETYRQIVKLTFAKGAFLADPRHLFNAGLTGNARRAIDLRAQDEIDGPAFRELIREAVVFNQDHPPKRGRFSGRGSSGR